MIQKACKTSGLHLKSFSCAVTFVPGKPVGQNIISILLNVTFTVPLGFPSCDHARLLCKD